MISLDAIWTAPIQQRIFRKLLHAMSYPARVVDLAPELDGSPAMLGVLACLLDTTTTFCDLDGLLPSGTLELLETKVAHANEAGFVLADATVEPRGDFVPNLGDIYHPDKGATLILVCESSRHTPCAVTEEADGTPSVPATVVQCTGPGIKETETLTMTGVHRAWFAAREKWVKRFPMGVDLVLCEKSQIVGLPRTTVIAE